MRIATSLLIAMLSLPTVRTARAEEPEQLRLSLDGAIRTAIERSPEFVILSQDLSRAAAQIDYEEAAFHPTLIVDARGSYLDEPGGTRTFAEKRLGFTSLLGLQGTLPTGLRYQLGVELLLERVESEFTAFERGQTLRFSLDARQPLLRGGWLGANRAAVVIRTIEAAGTKSRSYARAAELLAQVESLYWRLVLAREELLVQRDALKLSDRQVEDSRAQLRLGSVSPIQVLEAETAVARRQAAIEAGTANLAEAEAALLALILDPAKRNTEITVVPTDQPKVGPVTTTAKQDLEAAFQRRDDLMAARSDVEAADAALELAQNALFPALDLVVGGSVVGFSGRLQEEMPVNGDPDLVGGFGDVFGNTNNPYGFVGLRLELPLTNDRAQAAEQIAGADQRERLAREEELKTRIYSEVLSARRSLLADLRRVDSAKVLVERTEALLKGQRQSFKAGAAVSFDVVRATVQVTRARIELLRALVSAHLSRSRLLLAKGEYLPAHQIELKFDVE